MLVRMTKGYDKGFNGPVSYLSKISSADLHCRNWTAQSEGVLPNCPRNQREKSAAEEKPSSSATSYNLRLLLARYSTASSARTALMTVVTLSPSAARCRFRVRRCMP